MCPISRLITVLMYKSLAWVMIIHVGGKKMCFSITGTRTLFVLYKTQSTQYWCEPVNVSNKYMKKKKKHVQLHATLIALQLYAGHLNVLLLVKQMTKCVISQMKRHFTLHWGEYRHVTLGRTALNAELDVDKHHLCSFSTTACILVSAQFPQKYLESKNLNLILFIVITCRTYITYLPFKSKNVIKYCAQT